MLVTPVSRVVNSYLAQNKSVNRNVTIPAKGDFQTNNAVTFTGLDFLTKILSKKQVLKTVEDVLKVLEKKDSGLYALTEKGFVSLSREKYEKFSTVIEEVVIKQGLENGKYRTGISPSNIISFLERGHSKVTMVADDGIHKLELVNNKYNKEVLPRFIRYNEFDEKERLIKHDLTSYTSEDLFNLSNKIIKESGDVNWGKLSKQ